MKLSFAVLVCLLSIAGCKSKNETVTGGLSPQQALGSFRLPEGFTIELVASEPMVADPVAMEVDENGNFYVVEMHGYPLDTSGAGTIKLLTDTTADGLPDKSTVFADHLKLPTGIMRWKKGVLVVDVPDVLYLEDTDNDGKADVRKTILTGMALTNPQHIANTPLYGLDNWIYLAHMGTVTPKVSMMFNDSGSLIRFTDKPDAPTLPRDADGRNIRFKPGSHQLEMLSGESQYGQSFDNWGHHFCVENADHIFHEVLPARYLQRNPNLLLADASAYISDHGDACAVYPITVNPENQLLTDRGVVTSACGITWYNGGLFPDSFSNVTFVCEPTSNLVHADRLTDNGATFTASALYPKKEFLASTDGWFRPVQLYIGPDGALYVIDYYRQIIEHPEWLSEEVINSGALYNGSSQGRIYRIAPKGAGKMKWCNNLSLDKASTDSLVQALTSNNSWWRRTAQRLLMDRQDTTAIEKLKALAVNASPTAVVHALWSLEGLGKLDEATLAEALKNSEAGVRENAVQLAELHLADFSGVSKLLPSLQNDPSAKVRFQLLCTLGNIPGEESAKAQQQILLRDIEDKWVQTAALTSASGKEWALLKKTLPALTTKASEGKALFFSNCAAVIGLSQNGAAISELLTTATTNNTTGNQWWQAALLNGLKTAFATKPPPADLFSNSKEQLLSKFNKATPPQLRSAAVELVTTLGAGTGAVSKETLVQARQVAGDKSNDKEFRADALKLLALDTERADASWAQQIITADEPSMVQQAAIKTYRKLDVNNAAVFLVKNWSNLSPGVQDVAMDVLFSNRTNMLLLLNAVGKKAIPTTAISWPRKVHLMNNDDEAVRGLARRLLAGEVENRELVYKQYLPALSLKGDTAKGRLVFTQVCGACHQYEGKEGKMFGPDISTVRNREKSSVMLDILDPNRSIAVKYDLWTVSGKDGSKWSGIIQAETPAAVTLMQSGGQPITISRSAIKDMATSGASAMPVGLEASLTKEQMAHLLAFITGKE